MALDTTSKAIATHAWTQLLDSILSGDPPCDMSKYYFFWYQIIDYNHFQHNLKRLEIHKYKLGTENIRAKISLHSQVVQTNEQGVEHIQDSTRSVVPANEDAVKQGIEHIQYGMRSGTSYEVVQANENQLGIDHIQYSMRSSTPYQVVQANEDEIQQGIEHIQYCMRSTKHYEVLQANDQDYNQQGIDHIQNRIISAMHYEVMRENEHVNQQGVESTQDGIRSRIRSRLLSRPREYDKHPAINNILETGWSDVLKERACVNRQRISRVQAHMLTRWFDKLLDLVEDGDLQQKEKVILNPKVVCLIKLLHHYGVDTIRSGVAQELENLNQEHVNTEKGLEIQYKNKVLEHINTGRLAFDD